MIIIYAMNSFLHTHNGTSLTGIIDLIAHSISIFQEMEAPKNINDIFMNKNIISTAEPYDVQIDEMGDNIIQMYQFIGDINDTKVAGLESLLNYMNENFFSKDEPAVNEHRYHITKNNTLMKQIIVTMSIKVNLIISKIIDIQMNIIIINNKP